LRTTAQALRYDDDTGPLSQLRRKQAHEGVQRYRTVGARFPQVGAMAASSSGVSHTRWRGSTAAGHQCVSGGKMSSQAGAAKHFLVTRSFVPCIDVPLLLQTALLLVSEIVQRAARTLAVSIWVGTIFFSLFSFLAALLYLPHPAAAAWIAFQLGTLAIPLSTRFPGTQALCAFAVKSAEEYWGVKLTVVNPSAIKDGQAYVIGFEPHSAMPICMPIIFHQSSALLPKALKKCRVLASTAVFWCPFVAHLYYWLGVRPVSRKSISQLLRTGHSVVLNPGGVQECIEMGAGREVAFLRQRRGFVRVALSAGAPLVPVFAFGQTSAYNYWRLGPPLLPQFVVRTLARRLRCLPMLIGGFMGTPIPLDNPMHVVIGEPIPVPKIEDPSKEEVEVYLQMFIHSIQDIFEKYKQVSGQGGTELVVL